MFEEDPLSTFVDVADATYQIQRHFRGQILEGDPLPKEMSILAIKY